MYKGKAQATHTQPTYFAAYKSPNEVLTCCHVSGYVPVSQANKSQCFFLSVTENTHLFVSKFILLHGVGARLFGTVVLRKWRREEAQLAPFAHFSWFKHPTPFNHFLSMQLWKAKRKLTFRRTNLQRIHLPLHASDRKRVLLVWTSLAHEEKHQYNAKVSARLLRMFRSESKRAAIAKTSLVQAGSFGMDLYLYVYMGNHWKNLRAYYPIAIFVACYCQRFD